MIKVWVIRERDTGLQWHTANPSYLACLKEFMGKAGDGAACVQLTVFDDREMEQLSEQESARLCEAVFRDQENECLRSENTWLKGQVEKLMNGATARSFIEAAQKRAAELRSSKSPEEVDERDADFVPPGYNECGYP